MQNLITFEKALKEHYLPAFRNQLNIEPSPVLSKIKKAPLRSNEIVGAAPIGLSGGFGFSSEGKSTPKAGGVMFERFKAYAKDMYVDIVISAKAVRLTGSGGAMANALDTEVKGAYDTAKWNVGRALFGNGTGVLTTTSSVSASNQVTVADTKYLKEGLIVDLYLTSAEVGSTPTVAARRITAVDRANKKITLSGAAITAGAGFITVQNSYGVELTGIGAIFDDDIDDIYGVSKTSNPYLKPVVFNGEHDISDGLITKALRAAKNEKNSQVDMLLCGDGAFDAYVEYLRTNNIRVEERSSQLAGGFKSIKFIFGNKEVDIVNEQFVPDAEIWGIDSTAFKLYTQEWNFADLQGGGIFNLMENESLYRALLTNYGELMCENPGGCVRIYDCV